MLYRLHKLEHNNFQVRWRSQTFICQDTKSMYLENYKHDSKILKLLQNFCLPPVFNDTNFSFPFFKKKYFLFEGWLLYRILFSVKSQHESDTGIHIFLPSWTSILSPSPSHSSRLIQSPCLSSLRHTANSHWLPFNIWYCKFPCYSLHRSHPLLPSLHVYKTILNVCFSTVGLKTNSSVPSFFLDSIYMH